MSKLISDIRYWVHCRLNYPPTPREKWDRHMRGFWESFFNYGFPPYCALLQKNLWFCLWDAIFRPVKIPVMKLARATQIKRDVFYIRDLSGTLLYSGIVDDNKADILSNLAMNNEVFMFGVGGSAGIYIETLE